jgi:hypothetical protein
LHEPIISKDLFEQAQGLLKTKVVTRGAKPNRDFLLAGLIKCSECGSGMNVYHVRRGGRRYFYYKCHKVIRNGSAACSIKSVSAERLENFLIERLCRIVKDQEHLDTLAYKFVTRIPGLTELENWTIPLRTASQTIKNTLENFQRVLTGSIDERGVVLRETVQSISSLLKNHHFLKKQSGREHTTNPYLSA